MGMLSSKRLDSSKVRKLGVRDCALSAGRGACSDGSRACGSSGGGGKGGACLLKGLYV